MNSVRKSLQIRLEKIHVPIFKILSKGKTKIHYSWIFTSSKHCHYHFVINRQRVIPSRTHRKCFFSKLAFIKLTIVPRHTLV